MLWCFTAQKLKWNERKNAHFNTWSNVPFILCAIVLTVMLQFSICFTNVYRIEAWKWVASSKRIIGAWPGSLVLCFVCYIWIRRWNRRNMMMLSIKCFLDDRLRRKFIVKYRQLDRNTVTHFLLLRRTQFTCSIYFSILLGPIFTVWKTTNVQEREQNPMCQELSESQSLLS